MPKTSTKTTIPRPLSNIVAPNLPLQLLGNITPAEFMSKYWQKKPLLIRGAIAGFKPFLSRDELFAMAEQEDVESRLIVETLTKTPSKPASKPAVKSSKKANPQSMAKWTMANGPIYPDVLPALKTPNWTLLVQGVDLHNQAAYELKNQFRFAPDARLDDLMISFATDGGGVGPHFDSYDVFLLQAQGQRRWRIGKQKDLALQKDVPLKILANFAPEQEFVLEAGDMLYLPPMYAHEGVAVGECMTYSIGFRAPAELELARELLQRFADDTLEDEEAEEEAVEEAEDEDDDQEREFDYENSALASEFIADTATKNIAKNAINKVLYKDPKQTAVEAPAQIPAALLDFAKQAVEKAMSDPDALARNLGEYLTEPKANVWFDEPEPDSEEDIILTRQNRVDLHPRSQMLFDALHIFLNGESWRAAGADAKLMQKLANQRFLEPKDLNKSSDGAMALLQDWADAGWLL
jgi:50S ribosomal protein L16 3-hydroxylase